MVAASAGQVNVVQRLLQAYRCSDLAVARQALQRWYGEPLGQSLWQGERTLLDEILPGLFGYHLLQVGLPGAAAWLATSRISHRMLLTEEEIMPVPEAACSERCVGSAEAMPLATDTLDVVLLPHTLEFSAQPHQVLREVDRVLIPEGHLLILGFNPWSLWGGRRLLTGWRDQAPWCGRFLSAWRLKDWLSLLGFDTVLLRHFYFRPPLTRAARSARLQGVELLGGQWWPVLGGAYLLVAKKRVATLTPVRPRWRPRRALVATSLAGPAARRERP